MGWLTLEDIASEIKRHGVYAPRIKQIEKSPVIDLNPYLPPAYRAEDDFAQAYFRAGGSSTLVPSPLSRLIKTTIVVDKNLAWLLGLWLAEGSANNYRHLSFAYNRKETDIRDRVVEILKAHEIGQPCLWSAGLGGCQISIGNAPWASYLRRAAGVRRQRQIPVDWLEWPQELQFELLFGYLIGDGHIRKSGSLIANSSSRALAYGIRELFYRLECPAVMGTFAHQGNPQWTVKVAPAFSERFTAEMHLRFPSKLYRPPHSITAQHKGKKFLDGFIWHIMTVEDGADEIVYNLEVDGGSYLANGMAVHNCDASSGAYNELVSGSWSEGGNIAEAFGSYDRPDW